MDIEENLISFEDDTENCINPSNQCKSNEHKNDEKLIIVTGFGPFIGHELINASWEAVRMLPNILKLNDNVYKIEKKLVSVVYDEVDKCVDEIWKEDPVLVVHCGVHGGAKSIHIENLAYNNKFTRPDYTRKRLPRSTACLTKNDECCQQICTKLDVKKIAKTINTKEASKNDENIPLMVSNDVGNYLCGYIYLKSLDMNCKRTLFLHVPPVDKPFSSEDTSKLIFKVIEECIEQIESGLVDCNDDILTGNKFEENEVEKLEANALL